MDVTDFAARPGFGCLHCNYTTKCEAFKNTLGQALNEAITNPEAAAKAYAVLTTRTEQLNEQLREVAKSGPIEVDGSILAFHNKEKRECVDPRGIVDLWFQTAAKGRPIKDVEDAMSVMRAFYTICEIGVTAGEKVLKKLSEPLGYTRQKDCLAELGPKFFKSQTTSQFGWKEKE